MKTCHAVFIAILFALPLRAQVVINEIFYHAPEDLENVQWIELHNTTGQPVNLSGWRLARALKLVLPEGLVMAPDGYAVLCQNRLAFQKYYEAPVAGEFAESLKQSKQRIELLNRAGQVVDSVEFDDDPPWPPGPDGRTASLERICPTAPGTLPENWSGSPLSDDAGRPGGTPGARNSSFSASLPPVIGSVSFLGHVSPQQSIAVEARVESKIELKQVALRYRVISPGVVGDEIAVPMAKTGPEGIYRASVPGQQSGQIVRLRVQAVDANSAERFYPAPTDPRPALSCLVFTNVARGSVPQAYVIHTDPEEARNAVARAQDAPRGSSQGPEGRARFMAQMRFRAALDLSALWTALTLNQGVPANLEALRPIFLQQERERAALERKFTGGADVEPTANVISDLVNPLRAAVGDALRPVLNPEQAKAYEAWRDAAARTPPDEPGNDPATMLRQFIPLESDYLHLAVSTNISGTQLATVSAFYRDALQQRDALIPRLAKLLSGKPEENREEGEKLQAEAMAIPATVETKLKQTLTSAQARQFSDWQSSQQPAFMRRGRSKPPEPALGANAFVLVSPQTRDPMLFDFVRIPDRSGGWKVRFGKDQPWDGMTTVDLVFEASERWLLAESLAYALHRRVGLAACRTEFVRLEVDGQPAGYYLAIEQVNKAFLRNRHLRDDGNLYKATWVGSGLVETHEKQTKRDAGHDDLVELVDQLEKTKGQPDEQWALIRREFEVKQVIDHYAVRMLISDWDGFFNNYFLYHDVKGTKKWTFYPWDEDKTWGEYDGWEQAGMLFDLPPGYAAEGDHPPGEPGDRPSVNYGFREWWRPGGYISRPLLVNPTFRKLFLARLKELLGSEFTEARLFPLIDTYREQLLEEVNHRSQVTNEDPAKAQQRFESHLASLKEFVTKRRQWLLEQDDIRSAGPFDGTHLK